jgi:hypothetical protein
MQSNGKSGNKTHPTPPGQLPSKTDKNPHFLFKYKKLKEQK